MDLFFVSQALKYTTATTQLLTDMEENPIYKEIEQLPKEPGPMIPSESGFICMMPSAVVTDGEPQMVACLSDSACGDRNKYIQATAKQAKACMVTTTCPRCTEAI